MTSQTPTQNWALDYLLPGLAYYIAAKLSLALAIPPSEAAAAWPATGIAIAAMILRGYRSAFAILIALLLFYSETWLDLSSTSTLLQTLLLCALISLAPLSQALAIVYMIRRFLGPSPELASNRSILLLLFLCGPIGCLIAPTLSMAIFLSYGIINNEALQYNWLTWWVGDSVGALTVTPLLLILFQPPKPGMPNRRISVGMPMLVLLALVFVLFKHSLEHEEEQRHELFNKLVNQVQHEAEIKLERNLDYIRALKFFVESSHQVTGTEFERFVAPLVASSPGIKAFAWAPRITAEQRAEYEQNPATPPQIFERNAEMQFVSAGTRNDYYPITYIFPQEGNRRALGFDIASHPLARDAQQSSVLTLSPTLSLPLELAQSESDQSGYVIYLPAIKEGETLGFAEVVLLARDYLNSVLFGNQPGHEAFHVTVTDITGRATRLLVQQDDTRSPRWSPIVEKRTLNIAGRQWLFEYRSSQLFIEQNPSTSSLILLIGGMFFTSVLGGWLLSLTASTWQIQRKVHQRTSLLKQQIQERKLAEQELKKLSLAVEHSPNMVMIASPNGAIEYINPKFTQITGYQLDELQGINAGKLYAHNESRKFYRAVVNALNERGEWQGEVQSLKKDGSLYWAQIHVAPIYDDNRELTHIVSVHQDITETKQIQERISYQARHDLLTGLFNRHEFERQLQELFSNMQHGEATHVLCFLDLDQFKVINDTSGHAAGDELLRQVAKTLREHLRSNDTVARLGGDEFGILMRNCRLDHAVGCAEKIRQQLEELRFPWEGSLYSVGVSIGVVILDQHSINLTESLKNADAACYIAKESGRNRVHVYQEDDELLTQRMGEFQWVNEITAALAEQRFELFGQLIIPINPMLHKPAIEVLLRLRTKDNQLVPPGAFLGAAERYGLASKVDYWVVSHALDWLAEHNQLTEQLEALAINLSGASLGERRILELIVAKIEQHNLPAHMIKFEITETAAISNLSEAQDFIDTIQQVGCDFALDDFGSGLSSFAYLKNLPVDYLKIDGMFVKDMANDPIDHAMVKSINEIGHVMGKKTIAEFVENETILNALRELGVDYAQGYGVSRPKPLNELLEEVAARV